MLSPLDRLLKVFLKALPHWILPRNRAEVLIPTLPVLLLGKRKAPTVGVGQPRKDLISEGVVERQRREH